MQNRFFALIDALKRHDVRFVIVGGVAAVLQRVPVNTFDFDIVHDRAPDNVARLAAALNELGAIYRHDDRKLRPNEAHLLGPGHQLLVVGTTDFDVLGALDPGGDYAELMKTADVMMVGGHSVNVLALEKLAEIKRLLPRPKDKLMLLQIEATLDERAKAKR